MTHIDSPTPNPIYDRLMSGYKGLSAGNARWLGIAIALIGLNISLLPMLARNRVWDWLPAVLMSGLTVLIALLIPLVGLALAAGVMGRIMTGEDWTLLRLTNLPADTIAKGCAAGVGDRLRLPYTIGLWALPAGLVGFAYALGPDRTGFDVIVSSLETALSGVLPAVVVIAIGMLVYRLLWRWCMRIGVWLALWLREGALAAGAALAVLGAAAYIIAPIVAENLATNPSMPDPVLVYMIVLAVPFALVYIVSRIAHNESIWLIEGPDDLESDDVAVE